MKLKRDEFKTLLKECILELVQEGKIFQNHNSSGSESKEMAETTAAPTNNKLNEAVRITTQLITKGDPKSAALFESIIADTAKTTLQRQLSAQMSGGADLMGAGAVGPEDRDFDKAQLNMFEANSRWAQLAFGNNTKSNNGQ